MPRRKQPHRKEVVALDFDPTTPFDQRRALYTRLSDDDLERISHSAQQHAVRQTFGIRQPLPTPAGESDLKLDGLGPSGPDRGYVITRIYRDWRTGVDPKRLALTELIADAHAGLHAGILFRDDDRLFRGVVGGMPVAVLHDELPTYTFEAAVGAFSIEDFAIHAHMSGRERTKTRERTMAARRLRAANGEAMHPKLPYWLERDPETRTIRLAPDRVGFLRQAIQRFVDGQSPIAITRWLTSEAPKGGSTDAWSTDRLREAMRSPALWGRLDYGRHKLVTERRNGEIFVVGRVPNPQAVRFNVPPVVHQTELQRAECRLSGGCELDQLPASDTLNKLIEGNNLRFRGRPALKPHPLRRRVVCRCGWRMAYSPKWHNGVEQAYGYLTCCLTHQKGTSVVREHPPCPTPRVRTRVLWPKVQDLVIRSIREPDKVLVAVEADLLAAAAHEPRTPEQDALALADLDETLVELDARENRLYKRWDAREISKVVYDGQTREIAAQRQIAQEAKRLILDRERILQQAADGLKSLREGLVEAQVLPFETLDLQQWTSLFARLISDVVLDEQGDPTLRWQLHADLVRSRSANT